MIYSKYGIRIFLMKEEHIEMVRHWRNDPVVVANYAFRDHITPEMQKEWFRTVYNNRNLYTIIEYQGENVGVINLKNIDWEKRTFETGVFIPYTKFHLTPLPAIVSFLTTEIPFNMFDWNTGYAHVLKSNTKTQAFIKQLGYVLSPGQEDVENQEYTINRESFNRQSAKLRKAICALVPCGEEARLLFERQEGSDPVVNGWEEIVQKSSAILRVEEDESGRTYFFP